MSAARRPACAGSPSSSASGFGKKPVLKGTEAPDAWLINASESMRLLGQPRVSLARMIDWTADWVARDMPSLGKDTHFDTRDGAF